MKRVGHDWRVGSWTVLVGGSACWPPVTRVGHCGGMAEAPGGERDDRVEVAPVSSDVKKRAVVGRVGE